MLVGCFEFSGAKSRNEHTAPITFVFITVAYLSEVPRPREKDCLPFNTACPIFGENYEENRGKLRLLSPTSATWV